MKLSHGLGYAGVGVCAVSLALAVGGGLAAIGGSVACSSSSSSSSSGSSSGGSSTGDSCETPGVTCITPPPAPSGGTATSTKHNYAVHKLYLGDTDRSGVAHTSPPDWMNYGYNLDDKVTTKASTDVCTLYMGSSKSTQVDGTGGIDNSFGANIIPIVLTTAGSDAATRINTSINTGSFTIMAYVTGFDDTAGSMANATGLSGVLLAGGSYSAANDGGAPSWDTNTHWPIKPELLDNCPNAMCPAMDDPVAHAKIKFPMAYQANGTFVNGSPADLDLSLSIGGQALDLKVHSAIITFQPKGPGHVTNGNIGGVINTEELITSLKGVAGHISTSLCSGSAFDSIAAQIRQASDIIIGADGSVTNPPMQACNGISIGIGFDGDEIAAPAAADVAGPTPPAADPCAPASDAGMGGGG